jgi:acid stress-induced BolA-like protein IbaG/YrbA
MDAATVKALLQSHLKDCQFQVQGEGDHYDITAVGALF